MLVNSRLNSLPLNGSPNLIFARSVLIRNPELDSSRPDFVPAKVVCENAYHNYKRSLKYAPVLDQRLQELYLYGIATYHVPDFETVTVASIKQNGDKTYDLTPQPGKDTWEISATEPQSLRALKQLYNYPYFTAVLLKSAGFSHRGTEKWILDMATTLTGLEDECRIMTETTPDLNIKIKEGPTAALDLNGLRNLAAILFVFKDELASLYEPFRRDRNHMPCKGANLTTVRSIKDIYSKTTTVEKAWGSFARQ